uniref:methyltransferase-like protein 22 isoform X2 n=1 Tax=Myxine glutinosa TaxID=7769 RepID=UPI00358EE620
MELLLDVFSVTCRFYGTMDSLQFRSDLVLSDVHLFMPNAHHFMVRLGLCVFVSRYQIRWPLVEGSFSEKVEGAEISASNTPSEPPLFAERYGKESNVGSHIGQCQRATCLFDEDGDLLVTRRQRNVHEEGRPITQPAILFEHPQGEKDEETYDVNGSKVKLQQKDQETQNNEDNTNDEAEYEEEFEITKEATPDIITIQHTMATTLCDVGKQVWRASFLLCDYILHCGHKFNRVTALELGAGTGLVSITMATIATKVYCTDIGTDLLDLCQRNVKANTQIHFPGDEHENGMIIVRCLDWLSNQFCKDPENEFSWSEEEVADVHDHTTLLLAADVCYDDDLTDAFFRTVYRLMSNFVNDSMLFLAIEKRYNFTLRTLDVACEAYEHFRHCLKELGAMPEGKREFSICKISTDFPQAMSYDRVKHLELWQVTASTKELS